MSERQPISPPLETLRAEEIRALSQARSRSGSPADAVSQAAQQILDTALALVALAAFLPVLAICALIVKCDSPGPVLFKQRRVGKDGKEFWLYKFRSMVVDAEARRAALLQANEASGPLFKIKQDPRVTRSGRWLRKYSLDELPQLLNVVKGEMSLVGPRPALASEVAEYQPRQLGRLLVKPGITGLGQVSGRSDLPFERSVELDLEYVARRSVGLYLVILWKTVPAVLASKGAY
jgi:lipopolysaccharide/colanic/teichoic acid biosynthesis glycosyltransferase